MTPSSSYVCCKMHSREATKANKRRERRRAANDVANSFGYAGDGDYYLDWEEDFRCDGDCGICVFAELPALPPLRAPLVALALEAA